MSMKKKQGRGTEGYKNTHEENRGNEHYHDVHLFLGMSLAGICFMLLFSGIDVASASVTYDAGTSTIFLESGTNTLASIYSEVGDPSVLDYNSETNTYTLSASISGERYKIAHLHLEDTTLVFNNTISNRYYIRTWYDLVISSMTIKAENPAYPWLIWGYARNTDYWVSITYSDITGGHIIVKPNGFETPRIPLVIKNNRFHDIPKNESIYDSWHWLDYLLEIHGILDLQYSAPYNGDIYNNSFENCHIDAPSYCGMLRFNDYAGCKVDKLYISNCSVNAYGMTYFYGTNIEGNSAEITNFEIKDCVGDGLSGKEYGNIVYSNGTITNVSASGIFFYRSYSKPGTPKYWLWDITIDGANEGIKANAHSGLNVDIYNVKINDVDVAYDTGYNSIGTFYITNSIATNYNTLYSIPCPDSPTMEIREYQLADIHVVDTNGYPVETATVTIKAVNPDVSDCVINRKLESLTQTETLSKGHTPLPDEDETNTVALLSRRVTQSTDKTYTYTITAEKDGYTETVTVNPDESWYREDSNTYPGAGKGTVIITLPLASETGTISGTVKDTYDITIANATVSDGTRSATTDETGVYTLTDVPSGTYTVTSTKTGYQDASADNVAVSGGAPTEVDLTLEDTFSPYTSGIRPAKAATDVSRDTNIVAHIIDDGSGVDQSTLVMTVEGTPVSPTITGTANDYTVTYTPPTPFEYEQVADVTIAAHDLASSPNVMTKDNYSFTIESAPLSPDTTPPAAVTDLQASNPTGSSVKLTWTASGDDGNTGTASEYDIRYSASPITEANWNSATQCTGEQSPQIVGSTETFTVTGLSPSTTYYFALKTADEVPKWSEISNSPSGTTTEETYFVGEWHFSEGAGNIIHDSSGNGNDGTLSNMEPATDWVDGKLGKALQFDGVDDYIEVSDSTSLDSINNEITLIAWVKPSISSIHTILEKWLYGSGVNERSFVLYTDTDRKLNFELSADGTNSNAMCLLSENSISNDAWTHVAVTSDGTIVKIYINGEEDPHTATAPAGGIHSSVANLHIGRWEYNADVWYGEFNGVIDEVKIYSRALSLEEVTADYEAGLADLAPPASITNLESTTGTTWINWAWTKPIDTDFSYTMVYLNGVWQTNTSNTYYNATGLIANTSYEIGTHTVDTHGNVNSTWVNQTMKTEVEPDTTSPNITNVNVASITTNSATITWDTNEEADTKVTYDTNPASLGTVWENNSVLTKTHSITLTGLDDDKTYYYKVYSTDSTGNTANSTICNFTTLPVLPGNGTVIIQAQGDVTDNRLKEASPDTVLGSSNFIDVGRIDGEGNYRDVIWFDLSQLNSTDSIKTAKLSLLWYYVERNMSTTVEIYRPVAWAENYVTWNSRTDGVAWDNLGGDWYDRTNVAQGTTPYAAVTFPIGAADNVYHEFDVTELVQSYVDGTYENTGFFIKANEVSDSYIAFRSSDWTNADERPKLVVSYSSGAQQNTLSGSVTSPCGTNIENATVTLATLEGDVINTTQTDNTGNYAFTEISAGTYNLTVTKPRFWPATNITVTTGNTEDVMLWLKGDLNLNGTQADSGDLLLMGYAATGGLTPDWKFDLNGNGEDACAGDLLMLEDAAAGKIELW